MAIDFPNSPSNGDTFTVLGKTWTWNGTSWKVVGSAVRGISLRVSDTAPSDPTPVSGDMWYESDTGRTFTYYDSTWVELGNTASVTSFLADADADTRIHVEESADEDIIRFDTAGSERMVIDASGYVGIGTTSPSQALEVDGNVAVTGTATFSTGTGGNPAVILGSYTTGSAISSIVGGSDSGGLIEGLVNSHLVLGIKDNGATDSVSIVSGGGNYTVDTTYDTVVAKFKADGKVEIPGSFYLTGIASVPVGEWQSYTPGVSTSSSVGDGSTTGYYMRVGNIIHAYARFDLGSTSTWDNRFGRISAPVTAKNSGSTSTQDNANIVQVEVNDASASLNYIMGGYIYDSGANFRISGWRAIDATAGSGIRSGYFLDLSNDVTLADGDSITIKAIYMADD